MPAPHLRRRWPDEARAGPEPSSIEAVEEEVTSDSDSDSDSLGDSSNEAEDGLGDGGIEGDSDDAALPGDAARAALRRGRAVPLLVYEAVALPPRGGAPARLAFAADMGTIVPLGWAVSDRLVEDHLAGPDGRYDAGKRIDIVAQMSEAVPAGSGLQVTLNTGARVVLTAAAAGRQLTGSYTVEVGQKAARLEVRSYVFVSGAILDLAQRFGR
jgi:hypothetical protein